MSVFQTRAWQDAWWSEWGQTPGFERLRAGGEGQSGLYRDCYRYRRVLPIRCLQFVGTNYRRLSTPRTEYNGLAKDLNDPRAVQAALAELLSVKWSEAVFRDIREDSLEFSELRRFAESNAMTWRVVAKDTAYGIDTSDDFGRYKAGLGANTRLRFYNRRKILEGHGRIEWQNAWPENVQWFFEELNRMHLARWASPCFNASSVSFHIKFLKALVSEGGEPSLSVMLCDGQPISLLYNVRYQNTVYNIQSGFLEAFHRKLALGSLHLGYAIEHAFLEGDVQTFDLLAGDGKNTNYKLHIATQTNELISVMLVRSSLLKYLYKLKS